MVAPARTRVPRLGTGNDRQESVGVYLSPIVCGYEPRGCPLIKHLLRASVFCGIGFASVENVLYTASFWESLGSSDAFQIASLLRSVVILP